MTEKILYSPEEAESLVREGRAVLLDIRDQEPFEQGHIPGAVNVPDVFYYLAETTADGLDALHRQFAEIFGAAGLDGDKIAIVYEDALNAQYGGSCRGYWLLSYLGYPAAGILDGGLRAWTGSGRGLEKGKQLAETAQFPLNPQPELMVTLDEMRAEVAGGQAQLLDNRDRDEWLGESSSPYGKDFVPRKGRLPGATWLEWYSLMVDGEIPRFKSPDEIREIAAECGLSPDDDIIIYCFKGARASNTFVALRLAGFRHLRIYLGSWNEWSKDPELPIESGIPGAAARPISATA